MDENPFAKYAQPAPDAGDENPFSKYAPQPKPAPTTGASPVELAFGGDLPVTPEQGQANLRALGHTVYEGLNAASLGMGARADALGRVMGGSQPDYDTALKAVN